MNTTSEYTDRTYPELQELDLFNLPVSQAARDHVAGVRAHSEAYRNGDRDYRRRYHDAAIRVGVQALLYDHFDGTHVISDPEVLVRIEQLYVYCQGEQ